uniref:DNA-binding protein n=1 Tax=Thermofilum pendens TaxID=2269 RepID=A0A7C4BAQ4_THEPE
MKTGVYRNYNEFSALVLNTLLEMIRRTKGGLVTFNPKKIAVLAGIDTHPVILTLVKDVLEGLRERGLINIAGKSKHGVKYSVTKNSPLWALAKEGYMFTAATVADLERISVMASAQKRRASAIP